MGEHRSRNAKHCATRSMLREARTACQGWQAWAISEVRALRHDARDKDQSEASPAQFCASRSTASAGGARTDRRSGLGHQRSQTSRQDASKNVNSERKANAKHCATRSMLREARTACPRMAGLGHQRSEGPAARRPRQGSVRSKPSAVLREPKHGFGRGRKD